MQRISTLIVANTSRTILVLVVSGRGMGAVGRATLAAQMCGERLTALSPPSTLSLTRTQTKRPFAALARRPGLPAAGLASNTTNIIKRACSRIF